jgi:hypothetical protein
MSLLYDIAIISGVMVIAIAVAALFGVIPYLLLYYSSAKLNTHQLYISIFGFSTMGLICGSMISYRYIQLRINSARFKKTVELVDV